MKNENTFLERFGKTRCIINEGQKTRCKDCIRAEDCTKIFDLGKDEMRAELFNLQTHYDILKQNYDDVFEFMAWRDSGIISQVKMAEMLSVSRSCIQDVVARNTYKDWQ